MSIEAMKQALEALEKLFGIPAMWTGEGGGDVAVWRLGGSYRAQQAITSLRQAIEQAEKQEPVTLRRGDVLRCIETDELCTVWATSATHKTLVKWSGNDFSDYTAEQIGELFWLEPESSDVEIAAEQSDNYAAFHAGVRFARAHSLATPKQEEVEIDWPDYHEQAMGCGLEDRGITNRYEAMRYGWDEALDKAVEAVNLLGPLYTHPPQRTEQEPVIDKSAAIRIATALGWEPKREWVGLTDEEKSEIWADCWEDENRSLGIVEAKLKQKNGFAEEKNAICSPFMISELWRLQK